MMDRQTFYDNFGDLPHTADVAEVLARWRGTHPEDDGQQLCLEKSSQAPDAVAQARPMEPARPSEEKAPGTTGSIARWAAAAVAGASLLVATTVYAQGSQAADGNAVMIYTGKYNAADFERAKEVMVEGFSEANSAAGLPSQSYWMANPETHEIVSVSFFEDGQSIDDWQVHPARQEVLQQLEPLRSEAYSAQRYQVIGTDKASDDAAPSSG